jgi:hypothetical protein
MTLVSIALAVFVSTAPPDAGGRQLGVDISKVGLVRSPEMLEEMGFEDFSRLPDRGPTLFVYRVNGVAPVKSGPRMTFDRLEELVGATRSKHKAERAHAVEEIVASHRTVKAARAVTARLADPDMAVRERAAWGLGEMGYKGAIRPLIDALSYNRSPIKQAIARSLKKLTGQDFGPHYGRWWSWYEAGGRP